MRSGLGPTVVSHGATERAAVAGVSHPKYRNGKTAIKIVGLLAGAMMACQPVEAAPLLHQKLVLLDSSNAAVVRSLKQFSKTKERFGSQDPTSVLNTRLQDAQQQLRRVELLVKISQYDNARMVLREGSFKSLRMDLAYGQEMYRVVKPEAVRQIVEGVEQLDRQLRSRDTAELVKPQIQQLQEQLGNLSDLLNSLAQ